LCIGPGAPAQHGYDAEQHCNWIGFNDEHDVGL
jgi:hypothetical protein